MFRISIKILLLAAIVLPSLSFSANHNITTQNFETYNYSTVQPGDTIILADGEYVGNHEILNLNGTAQEPITIKSENHLGAIIGAASDDADTNLDRALIIRNSSHLIIEGIHFRNNSGVDGRTSYQNNARSELHEGLFLDVVDSVIVESCLFDNIATRGILVGGVSTNKQNFTARNNLFIDVGDDTASAGIALARNFKNWKIYNNFFATNVDGIMTESGAGGRIADNIFLFNTHENGIDIKFHYVDSDEHRNTYISGNVIYSEHSDYSGITAQLSSNYVKISDNVIYDGGVINRGSGIKITGRCENYGEYCDIIDNGNHEVSGNWLLGGNNNSEAGIRVITNTNSADVSAVKIVGNTIAGYPDSIEIEKFEDHNASGSTDGWNHQVYGNLIDGNMDIHSANSDFTYEDFNSTLTSGIPFKLKKTMSDKEIELAEKMQETFSIELLQKAYNKQTLPYPIISQAAESDSNLVLLANEVGMLTPTNGSSNNWVLEADSNRASNYVLKTKTGRDFNNPDAAGKISFRVRFLNESYSTYHLYGLVSCTATGASCSGGDSFYKPTTLDNDINNSSSYSTVSAATTGFEWIYVGSYTVNNGLLQRLTFGGREYNFGIDTLVFDTRDNLLSSTSILDNLVCEKVGDCP